jgi:hypothetical protein
MLHASLPSSVVLCYAHVYALPEPFSPCNLPNQSGYGCIQVPSGERLITVADSEGSPRCLLVQIALDPTLQFTAEMRP